ncbi:Palmitoyltransferase zdhhc17, partial [Phlyctochytrium bullatum]
NNQLAVARYLIEKGAEIDAVGGELMATPLQWASRSGHIQMVTLLIHKGSNPLIKDNQGYNALHLAAHAGHSMMLIYLVAIGVDVDSPDTMGRTALMWTAYQGNSIESMNAVITQKATLDMTDSTGYTALHWAVISHHLLFAKILIEAGARTDIKDPEGKTPADWAKERGHAARYEAILQECSKGKLSGQPYSKVSSNIIFRPTKLQETTNRILYILPYIQLPVVFWFFSSFEWFISVPLTLGFLYLTLGYFAAKVLLGNQPTFPTTPYLTSVPQATIVFVGLAWFQILPYTSYLFFEHITFLALYFTTVYSFYRALTADPGYLRKIPSPDEQKKLILQLAEEGKLDPRNFCISCSIRRPLRSKHSIVPTPTTAVGNFSRAFFGALNHRVFILFTCSLPFGAWMFLYLVTYYFSSAVPSDQPTSPNCILGSTQCANFAYDPTMMVLSIWVFINSLWVICLFFFQTYQISVALTTNEFTNYYRFPYLIHPEDRELPPYRRRMLNPFNLGPVANLVDFWTGGGLLKDINWFELFDVPRSLDKASYASV